MAASAALSFLMFWAAQTVLLDRIAVTVAGEVITEGQVLDEIRIVAFLNGKQPDFSPAARRQAAELLVDQALIRREMNASRFPQPQQADVDKALQDLERKRFPSAAAFEQALKNYGISRNELLAHLRWEIAVLRFTDYRFRPIGTPGQGSSQEALTEQLMETWLKQSRAATRIQFFKEAFE